jgi:large subunit ribosomal protein L31
MKKAIHPKIHTDTLVKCACGNTFTTISTLPSIQVDICSNCHPLFTGQHKFVDTEGRIDKFNKKAKTIEKKKADTKAGKAKKEAAAVTQETVAAENQASLKDLLKKLRDEEIQADATEKTEN